MEAMSEGAKSKGDLVIGSVPQVSGISANPYNDVVISTGIGVARDFITA